MKNRHWLALTMIFIWLGASTVAMYWFTFSDYGEFDPQQEWLGTLPALTLSQLDVVPFGDAEIRIVHVQENDCPCNRYVNNHIKILSTQSQLADHQQYWMSAQQVEQAGFLVPATPMALVFKGNNLLYAGPYATGPFCAVDDSLIADILSSSTQLAGSWLNGLVKACRCLR